MPDTLLTGAALGSQEALALGNEVLALARGHGEGSPGARWKLGEDEGVGSGEFGLPFGRTEDIPAGCGDPVGPCEVGRGRDAFDLEEFGVVLGAGCVGDDSAPAVFVKVDEGEHFAANGFVSGPEDEVGSPLHGLGYMRESEEEGADAFGVHSNEYR